MRCVRWCGFIALSLLVIGLAGPFDATGQSKRGQEKLKPERKKGMPGQAHIRPQVAIGTKEEAEEYYKAISTQLGLKDPATILDSTLDDLLVYCGYKSDELTAKQIQDLSSDELAKKFPDEVLASAFFAPKITDVSGEVPRKWGWRKVVRLKPRPMTPAGAKSVQSLFLLFNHFQAQANDNPFGGESVNTQAMLTRGANSPLEDSAYWLVYGPLSTGGKITAALRATFDIADPAIKTDQPYFVPNACADCHGGSRSVAKLNYLDTDHWFDRVQVGDDFADLRDSPHGVLFDGGKVKFDGGMNDPDDKFKGAFKRLHQLNREILEQNKAVSPQNFMTKAVENWVKLHTDDVGTPKETYLQPIERGIPTPVMGGEIRWAKGNTTDEALLPLLNRYCFRCHSSVRFHVFNKSSVKLRASGMINRITLEPYEPDFSMPQDRILEKAVKDKLVEKLNELKMQP